MHHINYQYGSNPKEPDMEKCESCGGMPHLVKPGELGKIRVHTVTEMICPACGERKKVKRNTKPSEAVCKVCGYKNSENPK